MKNFFQTVILTLIFSASAFAEKIDTLLLFGDSYFDTGAGNALSTALGLPVPLPTPPFFNSRQSNGPIWVDYVSNLLDLKVINYAVLGAGAGNQNTSVYPQLGGLFDQINRFRATGKRIDSDTLVIMDGGANNLTALIGTPNFNGPGIAAEIQETLSQLRQSYLDLQALGAEKILAWNLADISLIPVFNDPNIGLTSLAPVFREISLDFNNRYSPMIRELNRRSKDNQIFIFDAYTVFNEIVDSFLERGIQLQDHTILAFPDGTFIITGPQPDQTIFYDQAHPTTMFWQEFSNYKAAYIDDIINAPRVIAANQDLAFESTRAHRNLLDNHYRTLLMQHYLCPSFCSDCTGPRFQFYTDGIAKWGEKRTRSGRFGYNFNTQVVSLGMDYCWSDCVTLGTSFAAQRTYGRINNSRGKVELHDYIPSIYACLYRCDYFLEADLNYHYYKYNKIRRNIPFIDRRAKGHTHADGFEGNFQGGYTLCWNNFTFMPQAGLVYQNLHLKGYTERNAGLLNLRILGENYNSLLGRLGAQVFWNLCDCQFLPFAELFYEHEFLRYSKNVRARPFNWNDGSTIRNKIGRPDRDFVTFAIGVNAEITDCISGNISYQGETDFYNYTNSIKGELYTVF